MKRNEEFYELSNIIDLCDSSYCDYVAEVLTEEGYRKEKYVKKETAKEILQTIWDRLGDGAENDKIILSLFAKYGVEVDE